MNAFNTAVLSLIVIISQEGVHIYIVILISMSLTDSAMGILNFDSL
jgi:hypothetical protein